MFQVIRVDISFIGWSLFVLMQYSFILFVVILSKRGWNIFWQWLNDIFLCRNWPDSLSLDRHCKSFVFKKRTHICFHYCMFYSLGLVCRIFCYKLGKLFALHLSFFSISYSILIHINCSHPQKKYEGNCFYILKFSDFNYIEFKSWSS